MNMVAFSNLEVVDYLRSGALLVAFFATVFADKKGDSSVWITADALAGGAFGVGLYLFPNVLLDYQVSVKYDPLMEHMLRVFGGALIGMSIVWYYSAVNKDRAVSGAWLLHRLLAGYSIFMVMWYASNAKGKKEYSFKDQHCTFGLLACGLWTVGNFIHLLRGNSLGSVRREGLRKDSISTAIIVDFLIVGTSCIFFIGQPEAIFKLMSISNVTPFHLFIAVLTHVFVLSTRIYALMALNFTDENDKKAYFKGSLWFMVLIVPWIALLQWQMKLSLFESLVPHTVHLVLILNAMRAVGCLKCLPGCCSFMNFFKGE